MRLLLLSESNDQLYEIVIGTETDTRQVESICCNFTLVVLSLWVGIKNSALNKRVHAMKRQIVKAVS